MVNNSIFQLFSLAIEYLRSRQESNLEAVRPGVQDQCSTIVPRELMFVNGEGF